MRLLSLLGLSLTVSCVAAAPSATSTTGTTTPKADGPVPQTEAVDFEKFHGVNLLGKFSIDWSNDGFPEDDFVMLKELGFNFARLPLDYRSYTKKDDWLAFDEAALAQIDRAVEFGQRHGVHVCINLHRGPGYTVAEPREKKSLWADADAQAAFTQHWQMLAQRYRSVPPEALSFNLVNEPAGVSDEVYGKVMRPVIEAIRKITPGRPIVADGLEYGALPAASLAGLHVVQATRGYQPFGLTHYKASWVSGADSFPLPVWPPTSGFAGYFYGPAKPDLRSPLTLKGQFPKGTKLSIAVHQVSQRALVAVSAGSSEVWRKDFQPGPGSGEWSQVVYAEQWKIYQNIYDKTYDMTLKAPTDALRIELLEGDWMVVKSLEIDDGAKKVALTPSDVSWGARQSELEIGADGKAKGSAQDGPALLREKLKPWIAFRARGERIIVGEFGVFSKTPHDVALAWMKDLLDVYRAEHLGWAIWNLRGDFGLLDSKRSDVTYVDYKGHQLDKKMADLLTAR